MPGIRELLERFRPAGTPGAATAAGVPADRRDAVVAELRPVFAALAETERECDKLRDAAVAAAEQCSADSAERGRAILAAARTQAPAERAAAASRRCEAGRADVERVVAAGLSAAHDERRRADERLPRQLAGVVAAVRADFDALARGDPT